MGEKPAAASAEEAVRRQFLIPAAESGGEARRQTLSDMLRRTALRVPEKPALICGEECWTYAELDARVTELAAGLAGRGLRPGDRVAALARNSHWYVALRYAVARMGGVFVPVNFMLNADDIAYILDHCEPEILFVDASCAPQGLTAADRAGVRQRLYFPGDAGAAVSGADSLADLLLAGASFPLAAEADGRAIAQIIYTSGTESRPKGAMISHEAVLWQIQSCLADCRWTADSVQLNAMPLFHCAQLDAFLAPSLQVGGTNIIIPAPAPDIVIPMIERFGVTHFFAPPTVWISLLRSPLFDAHDLTSLRSGFYGASIMPVEVLKEMQQRLPKLDFWNCYGQTEITCIATVLKPEDQMRKAGSAGKPILHVETRIVDDGMRDVAVGEVGEIVHRSPQLLTAYWRDPDKTAEAFAGGWFHSGDLGVMDDEGFISVVDRKKDMIKSGGENVSSREVEEVVYQLAGVSEASVIGVPDAVWIEAVAAVVVARQGTALTEAEVIAHCSRHLSRFKVPKRVIFADSLPRNASGKILKRELRERILTE